MSAPIKDFVRNYLRDHLTPRNHAEFEYMLQRFVEATPQVAPEIEDLDKLEKKSR